MDVELLFSSRPFGQTAGARSAAAPVGPGGGSAGPAAAGLGKFSYIRPRATREVVLPPKAQEADGKLVLDLDELFPALK